jgi:hypothetical protein
MGKQRKRSFFFCLGYQPTTSPMKQSGKSLIWCGSSSLSLSLIANELALISVGVHHAIFAVLSRAFCKF